MVLAIIGIVLFLILVLVAIRIGLNKENVPDEEPASAMIHASGIYSIVRRSPREQLMQIRPSVENIRKYLLSQNEFEEANYVDTLIERWTESLNRNIETIEQGDKDGVEFYFYEFTPVECPVCLKFFRKGNFVTRQQIYHYPRIIPPFHIGCTCCIIPHHGVENLKDTTEQGMIPLFPNDSPPALPDWKTINKQPVL
jgi:hypothetical protein